MAIISRVTELLERKSVLRDSFSPDLPEGTLAMIDKLLRGKGASADKSAQDLPRGMVLVVCNTLVVTTIVVGQIPHAGARLKRFTARMADTASLHHTVYAPSMRQNKQLRHLV